MSDRGPWVWVAVIAGGILVAAAIIAIAIGVGGHARTASRHHAQVTAEDRLAQSDLRNAIAAAKTYFTDGDTYAGFDPSGAVSIEPELSWVGDAPALPGIVSINLVSDTQVVMSTVSLSGQTYCIGDAEGPAGVGGTTFGRTDGHEAIIAADCSGGW